MNYNKQHGKITRITVVIATTVLSQVGGLVFYMVMVTQERNLCEEHCQLLLYLRE